MTQSMAPKNSNKTATDVEVKASQAEDPSRPPRGSKRLAARRRLERELAIDFPVSIPAQVIREDAQKRIKGYQAWVKKKQASSDEWVKLSTHSFLKEIKKNLNADSRGSRLPNKPAGLASHLPYFDWRLGGIVPPVRDQGDCNACWAIVATAAFESAIMRNLNKYRTLRPGSNERITQFALSVQNVLDCVQGDCIGGWPGTAFNHFILKGTPVREINSKDSPVGDTSFVGRKRRCRANKRTGVKAIAWDFVNEIPDAIPPVEKLKEALLEHGPLVVLITKDEAFDNYEGGIFRQLREPPNLPNHAVLLTGWHDKKKAWIIQNSQGKEWGTSCITRESIELNPIIGTILKSEKGCMYIRWGSNNVGKFAAWVEAPFHFAKGLLPH